MKFKKTEVFLSLLGSLTLFAALALSLHPTTGSIPIPAINIADGGQPPPPVPPTVWFLRPVSQGTPVSVADGGQPPPPIPHSSVALPA